MDRGQNYDNEIILGKAILESFVLEYTKDSIRLLKDCPIGYEKVFPLIKEENRYYLNLSMNGQPHDFFLDTGSADAITMPLKDTIYSQGPLEMVQDTLYVGSYHREITDWSEERAELKMGDITRHGWAIYNDYSKHPYSINPAFVFKEFVVDLKNEKIRLRKL